MDSIIRSAKEIINPTREPGGDGPKPPPADTSTPITAGSSSTGGLLSLLKRASISDSDKLSASTKSTDASVIPSPPASETTSPALKPKTTSVPSPITTGLKPLSPPLSHPSSPTSPIRSISPPSPPPQSRQFSAPAPKIPSSSSSQIFERNVQETHPITTATVLTSGESGGSSIPAPAVSKIPAHIATENHIPPVLEATSIAITDGSIDPDEVEIAVLPTHQTLASQHLHHQQHRSSDPHNSAEDLIPPSTSHSTHSLNAPATSPTGSDSRRRLSFISFSDIVQAEQADLLDSTILSPSPVQTANPGFPATSVMDQVGISGITETLVRRRTPSPMRYGTRGLGAGSPPRGSVTSFLPERREGEVLVETLGQALRKTGSGDLGKKGL